MRPLEGSAAAPRGANAPRSGTVPGSVGAPEAARVSRTATAAAVGRTRDAERSRLAILRAARAAFATLGLAGTRLETVARDAGVDKRLIYYYFASKEQLFVAVLEDAYSGIREAEAGLDLHSLEPGAAIEKLIAFSWHYYLDHPEFVRVINTENLHRARHLVQSRRIGKINKPLLAALRDVLERGHAEGTFRPGVDPVQLYLTIVGLTFYYVSNQHTMSLVVGRDLGARRALSAHLAHVKAVVLGYLAPPAAEDSRARRCHPPPRLDVRA